MQHEAWIFQSRWTQPILDAIAERYRTTEEGIRAYEEGL